MSRAAPLRFIAGVLGLWITGRTVILEWPDAPFATPVMAASGSAPSLLATASRQPAIALLSASPERAPKPASGGTRSARRVRPARLRDDMAFLQLLADVRASETPTGDAAMAAIDAAVADARALAPGARAGAPSGPASGLDAPFLSVAPASLGALRRRWSGDAYVFARGHGSADALGGTLGGGQVAGRVAYRLDAAGRLALFARGYAPLHASGAEVSAGIEAHPLAGVPLRLAVERRQRVDAAGRSAWMASAAGGVDARPLGHGLRLDAYGEAGVVGARRGDLFADGSVRVGEAVPVAGGSLAIGAGAWGAAQPGVARLDLGPQAALRLPAGGTALTLTIDWRLRAVGDARPRSGPALTLAAGF